ncbi:hypothetical protein SDC9_211414 [bioreactor metagenome]|uniref:Uncharacterized protein n=1 Tax=bioreactor metagenome TaxID=1076179 RepID=A0A645JLP7_9ZZZZ
MQDRVGEFCSARVFLSVYNKAGNAGICRAFKRESAGSGGNDGGYLSALYLAALLRVEQRLKIRSADGDEYNDVFHRAYSFHLLFCPSMSEHGRAELRYDFTTTPSLPFCTQPMM